MSPAERLLPWAGALLGLLWFLAVGGGMTLDPTDLDWLGGGDLAQHTLGWLHFRDVPWSFPLGRTPHILWPLPMTVGFSDSNPWVSVLLKPFSPWLPRDFQFIGPWLASCFMLQGWVGTRLMGLLTPHPAQRLLGAVLMVASPVLLYRAGHDTLCAHWMITALLYLNLRPREDARAARRALGWAFVINAIAAGVHPYLEVMVFALTLALLASTALEKHLTPRAAVGALAGLGVLVAGLFLLFGYVGMGVSSSADGFGHYSADTLSLLNPSDWTRVLPKLRQGAGQYEGFGYLGTGVLALAVVTLAWKPSQWWPRVVAQVKAQGPLAVAILLLTLLAFSSVITVAGNTVLSMRTVLGPLTPLFAPFRSSGRFIWVLHYGVMTGILALALWRWRHRPALATGLLVGAALLQTLDTPSLWHNGHFQGAAWPRLQAAEWERLDPSYQNIVLYPPLIHASQTACVRNTFPEDSYVRFGDLAYRKHLRSNSGYSARLHEPSVARVCEALKADVEEGRLAEDTVYVVDKPQWALFDRMGERVTCGELDGYRICVAAKQGGFRDALARQATAAPLE
ncbi:MAG: DUF6311 domain-containing protein [Cystobacter sp.]